MTTSDDRNEPAATGGGSGPGSVPPWQRTPAAPGATPEPERPATGPLPVGAQPVRPTATGAAVSSGAAAVPEEAERPLQRRPAGAESATRVTRVSDAPVAPAPVVPPRPAVEQPTRNIDIPKGIDKLPDLDAIHHPRAESEIVAAKPGLGGPLRATVQIRRIDPWSVAKLSLVTSVALFVIWMVAVGVLYYVLDGMGVWDKLNTSFGEFITSSDGNAESLLSAGDVFGYSALIGAVTVILASALTTIAAFLYNLAADLVGGVEVTFADLD